MRQKARNNGTLLPPSAAEHERDTEKEEGTRGAGERKRTETTIDRRERERKRENVTKGLIKKRRQTTRRGLDQARRSESVVRAR